MNRFNYQDQQTHVILGAITSLMQQLQTVAPHPDTPDYKGPLFISNSSYFRAADDQDGMLGTMLLEGLVGVAFSDAIRETLNSNIGHHAGDMIASVDVSQAMECYDDYRSDVEEHTRRAAEHGQGTMARLSGVSISKNFNARSTISAEMQAYMDDLPRRLQIERGLALAINKLNQLSNSVPAPAYAANAPRFAA